MIRNSEIHSLKGVITSVEPLSLRNYLQQKKRYFLAKRVFDIIVSLLVTIFILSWLIPVVALWILMDSRGPVFFVQRRVGRLGKSFHCIKFRTMVINEQANEEPAESNDWRITHIGNFLRKSNLDEFPQFLNVLMGHMSIVGPRPHMYSDCARFSSVIPRYRARHIVKPGITGLAQSKGFRGPSKDFASIFHRYQFDTFYIRNANFGLDLRIVRKTAVQTVTGIYGYLGAACRLEGEHQEFHLQLLYVARGVLISILPILLCQGFGIV